MATTTTTTNTATTNINVSIDDIVNNFGVFGGWPGEFWLTKARKRYGDSGKGLFSNKEELLDYFKLEKLACQQLQTAITTCVDKDLSRTQAYTVLKQQLDSQMGMLRAVNYLWLNPPLASVVGSTASTASTAASQRQQRQQQEKTETSSQVGVRTQDSSQQEPLPQSTLQDKRPNRAPKKK